MKIFKLTLLLILLAMPAFAGDIKSGDDVIAAMYKKYAGKWYKTLTFVQKTIHHKDDGTSTSEIWYEAMTVPRQTGVDFADSKTGDGILFADGKIYSFRDGKPATGAVRSSVDGPGFRRLWPAGGDDCRTGQRPGYGHLAVVHEEKWMGKDVYVVGAKQGDVTTPQFWVDKKDLVFVRLIQARAAIKSVAETQFNRYVKAKGGWVGPKSSSLSMASQQPLRSIRTFRRACP